MKRSWLMGWLFFLTGLLSAQTPQEVVLSASAGSRLGIAVPAPAASGVAPESVQRELHQTLLRDLEESGPFAVIRDRSFKNEDLKAWMEAGADWVVNLKVQREAGDDLEVNVQVQDAKSAKAVFTKRYLGKEGALRRIAHAIADDLVARLTGEKGVSGSRIVFVRQLSPLVKEIFQMDRDGSNLSQITRHQTLTLSPTVAKDGRLAYVTYRNGDPEIWGQRRPGGSFEKLFPTKTGPQGPCTAPAWSPDGRKLLFAQGDRRGNADLLLLDLETGRFRRLTDGTSINTEATWNPAGTQIAFTSDRSGSPQIYLMEEDGSNVRRLTQEGFYNASASWSPTGAMIAYVSRFEGKFDLFVYKLGEGKSYQVTTGVTSNESPDWAPDERRLVFSSGSLGGMSIYTTDLSGNTVRRVTEFAGCQSPKWTRAR